MNNREVSEVNLKNVVLLLWKDRKKILSITMAIFILTGIYTVAISGPKYQSFSKVLLTVPEKTGDVYGSYRFPSTDAKAYLNVLGDMYEGKVDVSMKRDEAYITITASDKSPEKAQKLAIEATNKYIELLRVQYKKNAIDYYLKKLEADNVQSKIYIDYNKSLIDQLKSIKSGLSASDKEKRAMANSVKFDMSVDEAAFTEALGSSSDYIDAKVTIIKSQVAELNNKIAYNEKYISDLKKEQEMVNSKYGKENQSELLNGKVDVMQQYISVINEPSYDDKQIGMGPLSKLAMGLILGFLLSCCGLLFKTSWENM